MLTPFSLLSGLPRLPFLLLSFHAEPCCQSTGWKGEELLNETIQGLKLISTIHCVTFVKPLTFFEPAFQKTISLQSGSNLKEYMLRVIATVFKAPTLCQELYLTLHVFSSSDSPHKVNSVPFYRAAWKRPCHGVWRSGNGTLIYHEDFIVWSLLRKFHQCQPLVSILVICSSFFIYFFKLIFIGIRLIYNVVNPIPIISFKALHCLTSVTCIFAVLPAGNPLPPPCCFFPCSAFHLLGPSFPYLLESTLSFRQ